MRYSLVTDGWHIAIRKGAIGQILNDTVTPFIIIKNGFSYWVADPFLFEYDNDLYIFVEYMDYHTLTGCIAYTKYNETNHNVKWYKVIEEPFHMSFPFIYRDGEDIYMLPETSQAGALYRYKCERFPDVWKRETIMKDVMFADTALLDNYSHGYTLDVSDDSMRKAVTFSFDGGVVKDVKFYSDDAKTCRLGGAFFRYNGYDIKVSQDCEKEYGKSLIFSTFNWTNNEEKVIKNLTIEEVNTIGKINKIHGVHTYNSAGGYEIIDLKTNRINIVEVIARLIRKVSKVFKLERL